MSEKLKIYFHVGLGKTGSTYLQKKVFPKLRNIKYIPTNQYRKSKIILNGKSEGNFLLSREFDIQLKQQLRWFVSTYPETKVIIVFRKHDQWLLSQYKRHVKNGWYKGFDAFFSLENDSFWDKKELNYFPMIQYIEERTKSKPLVLFYDELESDPDSFVKKIIKFTDSDFDLNDLSVRKVHTSYSEKQLSFLQFFTRNVFKKFPDDYTNDKIKHWLIFRPWWLLYHLFLYTAEIIPTRWVPKGDFPSEKTLREISDYYADDWEKIKEYVKE